MRTARILSRALRPAHKGLYAIVTKYTAPTRSTLPGSFHPSHSSAPAPPPTSAQLFVGFLTLGLISFGGALPHARRVIVEERRWLSPDEFVELLGLCQFLPGGNIINMSVAIGMRFRGITGALAAIVGLIAGPSVIVVLLGIVYERTQDNVYVKHLFAGLAAAAAGLLVAMAIKVVAPLLPRWEIGKQRERRRGDQRKGQLKEPHGAVDAPAPTTASAGTVRSKVPATRTGVAALIALAGFVAIAYFRVPLILTMAVLVPVSIAATITLERRGRRP